MESLLEFFPIGKFLDSPANRKDRRIQNLHRKAREMNVEPVTLEIGKPLHIGEARLILLHPGAEFLMDRGNRESSQNDLSLVFRLEYRQFSMLFTGDIERGGEEHLLTSGVPLKALFLKAPHHGSRSSNTPGFIQAVQPRAVIFSSGYLNPWRHPHPEVVERYRKAGAEIWRTDLNGAIVITTDGTHHKVRGHDSL